MNAVRQYNARFHDQMLKQWRSYCKQLELIHDQHKLPKISEHNDERLTFSLMGKEICIGFSAGIDGAYVSYGYLDKTGPATRFVSKLYMAMTPDGMIEGKNPSIAEHATILHTDAMRLVMPRVFDSPEGVPYAQAMRDTGPLSPHWSATGVPGMKA